MKKLSVIILSILCIVVLLIFISIPFIVNYNLNNLSSDAWLTFWGGYIGSAITALAALFALIFTYVQNEKQHKVTQDTFAENSRSSILPFINLSIAPLDLHLERSVTCRLVQSDSQILRFVLSNIGLAAAINTYFTHQNNLEQLMDIGHLAKDEKILLSFYLPRSSCEYKIDIIFHDMHGRIYKQSFLLTLETNSYSFDISEPELFLPVKI